MGGTLRRDKPNQQRYSIGIQNARTKDYFNDMRVRHIFKTGEHVSTQDEFLL